MRHSVLRTTLLPIVSSVAIIASSGVLYAQGQISSIYERFVLDSCKISDEGERHVTRLCAMKKGPDLLITRHEHGVDVEVAQAASGGLYKEENRSYVTARSGHFGDLFANKKGQTTVEWRVEKVAGKWKPFAAIYRTTYAEFDDDGNSKPRARLDVLKFGPDHACQAGTVEARIKKHNVKARELADASRGTNPCPELFN